MREMVDKAAKAAFRWSCVRAYSVLVMVRRSVSNLKPQTYWDVISLCTNIFSILRLFISSYPELDVVVIPHILRNVLYVKLNNIMVISLWIVLSILCVRLLLSQLRAKSTDMEFRVLLHESLFGRESHIFKGCVPILTILLTSFSLRYIVTIIAYIYIRWTVEFATILHALQLYPAVLMFLQSLFQGFYLLWMFALPSFRAAHMEKLSFQRDMREYIYLNIVFTVHCICLTVIAHNDTPGLHHLAIGEMAYRLLAIFSLLYLSHQITTHPLPTPCTGDNTTYSPSQQFLNQPHHRWKLT